jgi:FkbM family methyltransferase
MAMRDAHRAVADVTSVCRTASPAASAQWLATLVTHLPECMRSRSLIQADRGWERAGARFRTANGVIVSLPAEYTAGAREMYCRNVYFRTGLTMPASGWVLDLGANRGLFSVWAALSGAQVLAVEAQLGFHREIRQLAFHNGVADRVTVEIAVAGGASASGASVGALADDQQWSACSHGTPDRPRDASVPQLMTAYQIDRVRLLKMDIEGSEFAVLGPAEDLSWLSRVDQLVLELHRGFGDVTALVERIKHNGFEAELSDSDGRRVPATSGHADYAYFRRCR